jgi:hypothetical protein
MTIGVRKSVHDNKSGALSPDDKGFGIPVGINTEKTLFFSCRFGAAYILLSPWGPYSIHINPLKINSLSNNQEELSRRDEA